MLCFIIINSVLLNFLRIWILYHKEKHRKKRAQQKQNAKTRGVDYTLTVPSTTQNSSYHLLFLSDRDEEVEEDSSTFSERRDVLEEE